MASLRGIDLRGMLSGKTDTAITLEMLESGKPLPDDDPNSRNGGLDPTREDDLGQIKMYAALRQQGSISDKAWSKLIQRNPRSGVLFSSIGPSQEASLAKSRAEIGGQYFNPGSPEKSIVTGGEDDQMVRYQPAVPAKADVQGAMLAALSKGDLDYAKSLSSTTKEKSEKNINSYDLALRAEGLEVDDQRVQRLTPEQAKNALARTMPPTVVQTAGGSIVAPRGDVPGKPGGLPNFVPNPKDLSPEAIDKLSEATGAVDTSRRLLGGFKDSFAGYKVGAVGDAVLEYKKRFGDDSGMADWWQDYQSQKNQARNKLFGGALTDTEKREFEKADINPGMSASQIRKNLARQAEIKQRASAKITRAYQAGSYNQKQVEAAGAIGNPPEEKPETRELGGKTYIRKNGKWFEQ